MYELIQHQEVGSGGAASITFSAIPDTYSDLYLVISSRSTSVQGAGNPNNILYLQVNGSGANLSRRLLQGSGSSTASYSYGDGFMGYNSGSDMTANTFGNTSIYIPNYRSSVAKSISVDSVSENNATYSMQNITASLWNNTAAITSLALNNVTGNFVEYSSATLYGVGRRQAIGRSPQAVGGYINYANGYWYHTLTGSGSFVPFNDMEVEYLVVAGGGGGAYSYGGGGGAGGYRSSVQGEMSGGGASAESKLSLTASTNYAVVVGAGGAGGTSTTNPTDGANSVFSTITSNGGGAGGQFSILAGDGGSGGGAGVDSANPKPRGEGTAGQGFDGGTSRYDSGSGDEQKTGGGGGAGEAGENATISKSGDGGDGLSNSITGTLVARGGGGGGGARTGEGTTPGVGGIGGGGDAGFANNPGGENGSINTGGGAGAGHDDRGGSSGIAGDGGNGGSGVVIVRYKA